MILMYDGDYDQCSEWFEHAKEMFLFLARDKECFGECVEPAKGIMIKLVKTLYLDYILVTQE